MKRVDLIAFTEGCYRFDLDLRSWMQLIGGLVAPEFDHGLGVVGWLVRFPSLFQAEPVGPAVVIGGAPEFAAAVHALTAKATPEEIHASYFSGRPYRSGSELTIRRPADMFREHPDTLQVHDALGLATVDGEGFALSFAGLTRQQVTTTAADRARWSPLATHLAAGFRLRRRLSSATGVADADAVFTPDGNCLDAKGTAKEASARESLRSAVRAVERSRGPLRRKAPGEALRTWMGLVTGKWSLVDAFSSDGKRFVVARYNAPEVRDPRALSEPERQVVNSAAAGDSNKLIAYSLGLPLSSVRMHLANAGRKLGIQSRAELARLHAINSDRAEVRKLEIGGEPLTALVLPVGRERLDQAKVTASERAVAEGILEGATNAEIARRRKTSVRTIANQVAALLRKLEVRSRADLVAHLASATLSK